MLVVDIDQAIDYCRPPVKTPRTLREAQDVIDNWHGQYSRPVVVLREVDGTKPLHTEWGHGLFKVEDDGRLTLVVENYDTSG